jgi:hypothetical protein
MRLESLRWPLFTAAALLGLKLLVRYDHVSLGVALGSGACWYVLSRRKAWSLDRDRVGLPPR